MTAMRWLFHAEFLSLVVFALSILVGSWLRPNATLAGVPVVVTNSDLTFKQMHHAYLGVPLAALGLFFGLQWLAVVGLVLTADDAAEHLCQTVSGDLLYQSPVHKLWYATLGKWAIFAWINRETDDLAKKL